MILVVYMIIIITWIVMRALRDRVIGRLFVDLGLFLGLYIFTKFLIDNTL